MKDPLADAGHRHPSSTMGCGDCARASPRKEARLCQSRSRHGAGNAVEVTMGGNQAMRLSRGELGVHISATCNSVISEDRIYIHLWGFT